MLICVQNGIDEPSSKPKKGLLGSLYTNAPPLEKGINLSLLPKAKISGLTLYTLLDKNCFEYKTVLYEASKTTL